MQRWKFRSWGGVWKQEGFQEEKSLCVICAEYRQSYKVISTQEEEITANKSSRTTRSFNFIIKKEINGGGDTMSITTVKIHEKLTKLNGGYKRIDRYSLISLQKTKGDHVNGASYLNMEPWKMRTGVYISRIIQIKGYFVRKMILPWVKRLCWRKIKLRKNPGTAPTIRLKGLKLRVPVKGTSSHLKVLYGRYRIP